MGQFLWFDRDVLLLAMIIFLAGGGFSVASASRTEVVASAAVRGSRSRNTMRPGGVRPPRTRRAVRTAAAADAIDAGWAAYGFEELGWSTDRKDTARHERRLQSAQNMTPTDLRVRTLAACRQDMRTGRLSSAQWRRCNAVFVSRCQKTVAAIKRARAVDSGGATVLCRKLVDDAVFANGASRLLALATCPGARIGAMNALSAANRAAIEERRAAERP